MDRPSSIEGTNPLVSGARTRRTRMETAQGGRRRSSEDACIERAGYQRAAWLMDAQGLVVSIHTDDDQACPDFLTERGLDWGRHDPTELLEAARSAGFSLLACLTCRHRTTDQGATQPRCARSGSLVHDLASCMHYKSARSTPG